MKTKEKLSLRIILCPFILIYGFFLLFAGTLFPILPCLAIIGFFGILLNPIVWVLNKSGADLKKIELPVFSFKYNNTTELFLAATIYFWFPLYISWLYVKKGEVFLSDEF